MNKRNTLINFAVIAGILVVLNLISLNLFHRFDFSKEKKFTLSDSSKKIVGNLEDNLIIKAYFSKNLPNQYADLGRYVRDILSDYQTYSKGHLKYDFINPNDEDVLKEEAIRNKIQPAQIQMLENDKMEVREVFMGMYIEYQGNGESIPLIQVKDGLENDITGIIKRLSRAEMDKVALFTNPDDDEIDYQSIKYILGKNYDMISTDLTTPIEAGVKTLVLGGVKDSLATEQLYNIDQFVMQGGNLLIFQDRVTMDVQKGEADEIHSNIFDLLSSWKIDIAPTLVVDENCGQISVSQRQGPFITQIPVRYPLIPVVNTMNKENLIVTKLENLVLLGASDLNIEMDSTSTVNFTPLFTSSNRSGSLKGPLYGISFRTFQNNSFNNMLKEPFKILSGLYEGSFKSYFAYRQEASRPDFKPESTGSKIIVVTDSDFINDKGAGKQPNNMNFVLNATDYLIGDTSSLEIRSRSFTISKLDVRQWLLKRGVDATDLDSVEKRTKLITKSLNIVLPSLLMIVFGFIYTLIRKRKSEKIRRLYE
ncbi:MAG: Gldg family protein [Candidatus Cloacimonetes bacterium]|nr:Gldg family protein [Candidatus Cloacimonadota bacterium]